MGGLGDMLLHDLYSPDGDPHCSAPPSPVMLDGTQPLGDPPGSVPSSPAHGSAPASPDDGPAQSECGCSGSRTSRRTGSRSRSRSQERSSAPPAQRMDTLDMLELPIPDRPPQAERVPATAAEIAAFKKHRRRIERELDASMVAREMVANRGLHRNIKFGLVETDDDAERLVRSVAANDKPFYVGITGSPMWRWCGGVSVSGVYMPGHCSKWETMTILRQCMGVAGPMLERRLVHLSRTEFTSCCFNRVAGGGGVSVGVGDATFLYICEGLKFHADSRVK